jgi:ZIP family zinc transporter
MALFQGNVALAFIISIGAGLATMLGCLLLFLPRSFSEKHYKTILGVSMSIASGVIIYVSWAEIYLKALDGAVLGLNKHIECDAGFDGVAGEAITEKTIYGYTFGPHWSVSLMVNLLLFAGMFLCMILDWIVHKLAPETKDLAPEHAAPEKPVEERKPAEMRTVTSLPGAVNEPAGLVPPAAVTDVTSVTQSPRGSCEKAEMQPSTTECPSSTDATEGPSSAVQNSTPELTATESKKTETASTISDKVDGLNRLGLLTVLAIGLHNAPEGLATFTATLEEPALGLPLAIGIALHNIPEGICVAMPIYYATGSRTKAIFWTFISGIVEPIGGILGYLALSSVIGDLTYAVIFAVVAGMMIHIVIHEYLPTCHNLGINKNIVILCSMLGMAIMWLSIFLLNI